MPPCPRLSSRGHKKIFLGEIFFFGGGGGGEREREREREIGAVGGFQLEKKNTKNNKHSSIFVLMLYIKFQVVL